MADYVAPEYMRARSALLDALDALADHRRSVILVGAQAIYIHTGESDFAVSPFTYDADLALDPRSLSDEPRLVEIMLAAGFHQIEEGDSGSYKPGIYMKGDGSQVDLLVPNALGGAGRRGARLGPHTDRAAMKARGIEGALVDHVTCRIASFDERDFRFFDIEVAGPGALLVAKLHKVADRAAGNPRRQDDKDAFDVYRLLYSLQTFDLAEAIIRLRGAEISSLVTNEAITYLKRDFAQRNAIGTRMVMRHIEGIADAENVASSCVVLCNDLIDALQ